MKLSIDGKTLYCSHKNCTANCPNHKFGKIKAHEEGWFFSKDDDTAHCPKHVPAWVGPWRARKAGESNVAVQNSGSQEVEGEHVRSGPVGEVAQD